MIRSRVMAQLHARIGSPFDAAPASSPVPLPEASMRLLEFALASAAIGAAVLLGLAR